MGEQVTSSEQQQREVELEIAAFMGPHIKRARIVLVLVGALYAIVGYLNYDDVARARELLRGSEGAELAELRSLVDLAFAAVVFVIAAGIANIALAILAGTRTMLAFYAAMAIFVAHSLFQLYVSAGALITSWVWWVTAICLGMGLQAALKAERLRKQTL